jgi:hypothetical protein
MLNKKVLEKAKKLAIIAGIIALPGGAIIAIGLLLKKKKK